jgi:hypothetical protein
MMFVSVSGHKSESQQTRHAINALVVLRIHQAPELASNMPMRNP